MATDSRTWFYTTPTARPYFIEERVNHTLWKHRLADIHMVCTDPNVPIKMEGRWRNEIPIQFEFKPGSYFILRAGEESKELIGVMRQILMIRPSVIYTTEDGMVVVEYHVDGGEERWREVQGKPQYQNARRLSAPQK